MRKMEEESWICVDESSSSDEHFSDSDKVDSETEAELYSLIHFEGNLSSSNHQSSAAKNDTESNATLLHSDKMKYVLSTEKKECNGETELAGESDNFLQNGIDKLKTLEKFGKTVSDFNFLETRLKNFDKTVSHYNLLETLYGNEKALPTNYKVPPTFVNSSNSNQLAEAQSSKDKRKFDHSAPNYSSPPKKATTDSERNNIWENVDSSRNKNIQTNICEDEDDDDIVFITSESESDDSIPSKKKTSPHQNMSMPNIKIGENSKDLWFVNQEDTFRERNRKSRRYHDKVDITCSNCDRKGHHSRICPLPKSIKCFICGGEHMITVCKNRICGKCLETGHDSRSCWKRNARICALCQMQGHTKENCPDLWRRYHLTTQPGKIVPDKKAQQNSFLFCCKCGRSGHFGAVCNFEHRGYKNCFPTWPNVLSYDEPASLPVNTPVTTAKKPKMEKKDLVIKRKKNILTEAQKLARKERIKKRKQERKQLKRQEFLNSNEIHKVLKEKDFPRTPKNNSAVNLLSPRTQKKFSINPSSPISQNSSAINLISPRTQKNNSATNLFSPRTLKDDSVIILPNPKTKKNISVVDLTSPVAPKNNSAINLFPPKARKRNCTFNESSDLPESVRLFELAQAKRREKNRRRRLFRKKQNRLKKKKQSQNMST